ncbi:MAG: alpha/beta hydrolase [Solirubrobacteraceae bacterium]
MPEPGTRTADPSGRSGDRAPDGSSVTGPPAATHEPRRRRASPRTRVETAAIGALTSLPAAIQTRVGGGALRVDGQTLDPSARLAITAMRLTGRRALDTSSPEAMRAAMRRAALQGSGAPVEVGAVRDLQIAGPAGSIGLRHYVPPPSGPSWVRPGLLLFVHGGGHVAGDLDTHDAPCRLLCREAAVQVVSVDYALAPEHPCPAGLDDVLAAWRWVVANAEALGADPDRLAVAGDSAGGHLSARLAIVTRDTGERAPDVQLLLYPAVDSRHPFPSAELFGEGFLLTADDVAWFEGKWLRGTGIALDDPRISPLLTGDLAGVARAIVVTAGFDPLRDEGRAYAGRLRDAGVPAIERCATSQMHGFINAIGIGRAARREVVRCARILREELDRAAVAPR